MEIYEENDRDLLHGDNSDKLSEIDLDVRDDWFKYCKILSHANSDNPNKNSIRSHLIVNIKLAIKLKDENVQIGSVSFIDLAADTDNSHNEEEYNKLDGDSLRNFMKL